MATYPSYKQALGSTRVGLDDRVLDSDVNGAVHIRAFFPARVSGFALKHFLNPTEWAALLAFYDANRLVTFSFTWDEDNATYTCVFGSVPRCVPNDPFVYDVTVDLRQQS